MYDKLLKLSQNSQQAIAILESEIEPRDLILHTAQKFTEAEVDTDAGRQLQNAFRDYLNGLHNHTDLNAGTGLIQIDEG